VRYLIMTGCPVKGYILIGWVQKSVPCAALKSVSEEDFNAVIARQFCIRKM